VPYFKDWESLMHTIIVTIIAYAAVVVVLRFFGKRVLSKFNAFDLVVTVALGSTLATVATSPTVPLADGMAALVLLVVLRMAIAWMVTRVERFGRLVKAQPTLLLHRGRILDEALQRERIARDEVLAAVRSSGILDLARVRAVVLETSGDMSVIEETEGPIWHLTLEGVRGAGE